MFHKVPILRSTGLTPAAVAISEEHLFKDKLNIFVLDKEESDCAKALCDQHVRRAGIHYAQILADVQHKLNNTTGRDVNGQPYVTLGLPVMYPYHPSCHWVQDDADNYEWLLGLTTSVFAEYKYRFGRQHKYQRFLHKLSNRPYGLPTTTTTTTHPRNPPPQCLREEFRISTTVQNFRGWDNTVAAYREYYVHELGGIPHATWTMRPPPKWFVEGRIQFDVELEASFDTVILPERKTFVRIL